MGVEPGFLSSHQAAAGTAFVQTSPNMQAVNGESAVHAGQLMSIDPNDGKAYLCDAESSACVPAGFAATDHPLSANVDGTTKVTLLREGRIKGFTGLIPGALYYPSADTPGAVVPERGTSGPVISSVAATSGTGFLGNVHIRAGHRPLAGVWTITFPTATTCRVTPPGGSAGTAVTVADSTAYNGTIAGAVDFYIETASLTAGDTATITVSYTTPAAVVRTLDSPGNAVDSAVTLGCAAGTLLKKGLYTVATTATTATCAFNGGAASPALTIAAGTVRTDIVPGAALTLESGAVTAETNRFNVDTQELSAPVGIAVDETTLQILMGGIG